MPETAADRRGYFTRTWCRWLLEERGLDPAIARSEVAVHHVRGEIRSPRCMADPWHEAMLARCTHGAIHAVLVDLRDDAPQEPVRIEISATGRHGVYVPPGVALGYQTLADQAEVFLQHAEIPPKDAPEHVLSVDDVTWPLPVTRLPRAPHPPRTIRS